MKASVPYGQILEDIYIYIIYLYLYHGSNPPGREAAFFVYIAAIALVLDGSSEYVAHVLRKTGIFFK